MVQPQPSECRLHIVDVFAERRYAGNPLVVVVGAERLSDGDKQAIAAEMNFSETTFVDARTPGHGGYRVEIFTPTTRIAFAGHAILGTASVVGHQVAASPAGPLRLQLDRDAVTVHFENVGQRDQVVWFAAPPMELGRTCPRDAIAAAVGLAAQDIDPGLPVQQVSAGTAALLVPVRALDVLRRCRLDLVRFAPLAARGFPPLVYLFCRETRQSGNDLSARFFFDAHGVREDAATGNAAAFLGAYLLEHGSQPDLSMRIEQGEDVGRPSIVRLRARKVEGRREVSVGGRVIATVEGQLLAH